MKIYLINDEEIKKKIDALLTEEDVSLDMSESMEIVEEGNEDSYTTDSCYDILDGGRYPPAKFLKNKKQAKIMQKVISLFNEYKCLIEDNFGE